MWRHRLALIPESFRHVVTSTSSYSNLSGYTAGTHVYQQCHVALRRPSRRRGCPQVRSGAQGSRLPSCKAQGSRLKPQCVYVCHVKAYWSRYFLPSMTDNNPLLFIFRCTFTVLLNSGTSRLRWISLGSLLIQCPCGGWRPSSMASNAVRASGLVDAVEEFWVLIYLQLW